MDISRHVDFVDPSMMGNKSISIIGVGATGSHAALYLSQLGFGNEAGGQGKIKLFDDDVVAEHNLPNQSFLREHIDQKKVHAMNDMIERKCGFKVSAYPIRVENQPIVNSEYVMLLVDSMASRKQIIQDLLAGNGVTELVIETRMGFEGGMIYAFNPQVPEEVARWIKTWYPDDQAVTSACGTSQSIGITAANISSVASAMVVQHFDWKYGNKYLKGEGLRDAIPFETRFCLYPLDVMTTA